MNTRNRLKGKKSKKEGKLIPSKERWNKYEYATAFVVFSDKPIKNLFSENELSYGLATQRVDSKGMEALMAAIVVTIAKICGYEKDKGWPPESNTASHILKKKYEDEK